MRLAGGACLEYFKVVKENTTIGMNGNGERKKGQNPRGINVEIETWWSRILGASGILSCRGWSLI